MPNPHSSNTPASRPGLRQCAWHVGEILAGLAALRHSQNHISEHSPSRSAYRVSDPRRHLALVSLWACLCRDRWRARAQRKQGQLSLWVDRIVTEAFSTCGSHRSRASALSFWLWCSCEARQLQAACHLPAQGSTFPARARDS